MTKVDGEDDDFDDDDSFDYDDDDGDYYMSDKGDANRYRADDDDDW